MSGGLLLSRSFTPRPRSVTVTYNAREVVAVCRLAMAFGVPAHVRRRGCGRIAARIISIGVASVVFHDLPLAGGMLAVRHADRAWLCAAVTTTVNVVSLMAYAHDGHPQCGHRGCGLPSIIAGARPRRSNARRPRATGALIAAAASADGAVGAAARAPLFTLFAVGQRTHGPRHPARRSRAWRWPLAGSPRPVTPNGGRRARGHCVGRDLRDVERDLQTLVCPCSRPRSGLHRRAAAPGRPFLARPTSSRSAPTALTSSADVGVFPEVARTLRDQATPYRQGS